VPGFFHWNLLFYGVKSDLAALAAGLLVRLIVACKQQKVALIATC
jgi:hypothetical protein